MDHTKLRPLLPDIDPPGYAAVMQAIGNAVWRIQQLEETVQMYLVARFAFEQTVAAEVAETLLERNRQKTIGQLARELSGSAQVPEDISSRLSSFVRPRNWLIHHSHAECRTGLTSRQGRDSIKAKLEKLTLEAGVIQRLLTEDLEAELRRRGVSDEVLLANAQAALRARYGV